MTPIRRGTAARLGLRLPGPRPLLLVGELTDDQMIQFSRAFIEAVATHKTTIIEDSPADTFYR